ncbi:MAG TPA: hypothetical protein VGX48_03355 [Pyrinomonadaceae bacterium]|jgi:hypothetical protein|nr:hypothetical protein [Pyrinomonadaceae bacterium]
MYRPNFCADCGERVVRARWRPWTSRRFCPNCDRRFRRRRLLAPLALSAALAGGGFLLGLKTRPEPPPLVVERGALNLAPPPSPSSNVKGEDKGADAKKEPRYGPDGTAGERPTEPDEVISICGARTKKGTPCQRRVRGTGRCWQHRGLPAMLPPSKLVVPG